LEFAQLNGIEVKHGVDDIMLQRENSGEVFEAAWLT
jgi:hypothetical protein